MVFVSFYNVRNKVSQFHFILISKHLKCSPYDFYTVLLKKKSNLKYNFSTYVMHFDYRKRENQ